MRSHRVLAAQHRDQLRVLLRRLDDDAPGKLDQRWSGPIRRNARFATPASQLNECFVPLGAYQTLLSQCEVHDPARAVQVSLCGEQFGEAREALHQHHRAPDHERLFEQRA